MTVVALGQNVKTYPTTQCKFLLFLKKLGNLCWSVPPGYIVLNSVKPLSGMVYQHISQSLAAK